MRPKKAGKIVKKLSTVSFCSNVDSEAPTLLRNDVLLLLL